MCGRYSLSTDARAIASHFGLQREAMPTDFGLFARYNIAPSQAVPVLRHNGGLKRRRLQMMQWGLIPFWAKDPSIGNHMINARAETVGKKPAYRSAWKQRRCLIPADGFYEWQKGAADKQPFMIRVGKRKLFAFGGLWEHWQSPDGSEIDSCTILTITPNTLTAPIHDRMPVIIDPADYDPWLEAGTAEAAELLRPYPAEVMGAQPVSKLVNNPKIDEPRCAEPIQVQGLFNVNRPDTS